MRLGGLIYSLESFLQLNMCQELQILAFVCMYLDAQIVVVVLPLKIIMACTNCESHNFKICVHFI